MKTCDRCGGTDGRLVRYIQVSGTVRLRWQCGRCDRIALGDLPSAGEDLSVYPVARDRRGERPPCERCGVLGTEIHHWAPTALFGWPESDKWPTSYLCPPCHRLWHRVVSRGWNVRVASVLDRRESVGSG